MSPDDRRVLYIVVAVVGFLSCGCLCLPFGAALSLPVIANLRKAAQKVEADRDARQRAERAAARSRFAPRPPAFVPPSDVPFGGLPPGAPPEDFAPPDFQMPVPPRIPPPTPMRSGAKRATGLGALTESQRKMIYRSAAFHERMQEPLKKQIEMMNQRNLDTSHLERMLAERDRRHEEELMRLCRLHGISQEELEQIVAEGKRNNW